MPRCGKPVDVSDYRFNIPAPICVFEAGHEARHPCSARQEQLGEQCRFCGVALAQLPCPDCWTPMPDTLADQKALFARAGLSLVRTP